MNGVPVGGDDAGQFRCWELSLPHDGRRLRLGGSERVRVMGILNVTPDSFSDGGKYFASEAALDHALEMEEEGEEVIDIGGESTRPGSDSVSVDEQLARVIPIIKSAAPRLKIPISIDTTTAKVARYALDAGAQIVNDISALRGDPEMAGLLVEYGAPVVLMHMLGTPRDMQVNPSYADVVEDIMCFLRERICFAQGVGVAESQTVVDPGFGFGKKLHHNLEILRRLSAFRALGRPILVGISRKSMIADILGVPTDQRDHGTAATTAAAVERGVAMVRVHDVRSTVNAVKIMAAIHGRARN